MIRWIQLFFAILAFSTVVGFTTKVGVNIQCIPKPGPPPSPVIPASSTPAPPASSTAASNASSSSTTTTTTTTTPAPPASVSPSVSQQTANYTVELNISYPFNLGQQTLQNPCPGSENNTYHHVGNLDGSPQFFVMTGVLSLMYASSSLTIYLFFSSSYDSIPVFPVIDLVITAVLTLFWLIGAISFSSGVTLLKTTAVYESLQQTLCHGSICMPAAVASWKSLNIGLICGYTSMFVWGSGIWFVFKETQFHTPRDQFR